MHYNGVKLSVQNFISHIEDTLLKTMPDINQTRLQFIDVMNFGRPAAAFSQSVSSMTQMISGANVSVCGYLYESMEFAPSPKIARRKRAKSSVTQPWIILFRSTFVRV